MTDPPSTPLPATPPTKAELRARIRAARRSAPRDADGADRVAAAVLAEPQVHRRLSAPGTLAAAYVSLPWEPPTAGLRRHLRAAGVGVLLPVAGPDGVLTWVRDDGAEGAAWGVPGQPESAPTDGARPEDASRAAVVIVPALAATPDGRRLGQGGGYYDRFLAELPTAADGGPLLVALVGPGELLADVPTEPHDRTVDVVIVA